MANIDWVTQLQTAVMQGDQKTLETLMHSPEVITLLPEQMPSLFMNALLQQQWAIADNLLTQGADPNQMPHYYTPLSWACLKGELYMVKRLLQAGADPNGGQTYGPPPLHCAAQGGNSQIVIDLLTAGADINRRNTEQEPPLFSAIRSGSFLITQLLLKHQADPNLRDYQGNTALHLAAQQENIHFIEVISENIPNIHVVNNQGQNALHYAAAQGNNQVVQWLLRAGAKPTRIDQAGQMPIVLAAGAENAQAFSTLFSHQSQLPPAQYRLALNQAICWGRTAQLEQLMTRFDMSRRLFPGHPLILALEAQQPEVIECLLRLGVPLNSEYQPGKTPLTLAIDIDFPVAVSRLLKQGADLHHLTPSGLTPLSYTLSQNKLAVLKALLKGMTDHPDTYMPTGIGALDMALKYHHLSLIPPLIAAGAQQGKAAALAMYDQAVYLRKTGKVLLTQGQSALPGHLLVGLQQNLEAYGFKLSPALAERILTLSESELKAFYQQLLPILQQQVGAHREMNPMYPNFPEQVKSMSADELYLNALLHYWGDQIGQRILPGYQAQERPPLQEETELRPIGLGNEQDFMALFERLHQAKTALSQEDKDILAWFVISRGEAIAAHLPERIPQRENAALLTALLLQQPVLSEKAAPYLHTAVDVLRLATALSEGDVSLANNTRFISFPKRLRRFMLAQLERMPQRAEDFQRHPERFKRLGERLHPGEYRQHYPQTWEAFAQLGAGQKPVTFAQQVEMGLAAGDVNSLLPLLQTRPGELARRMDTLLRRSPEPQSVLSAWESVVHQVPSPLLLQLMNHFQHRSPAAPLRVFFPKGDVGKLQAIEQNLPELPPDICQSMVNICHQALLHQYAQRPPLGPCYIDPQLKNFKVPFALRSASKALRTVARGSHIPIQLPKTARFFIWWHDGKSRTDIDLSALALDENFQYVNTLAYYNLQALGGYHSGDITSAPEGASEFIDIDRAAFLAQGVRYVLMVINSYTEQPFCDLPECFAGVMAREYPNSGEIYEPRTVLNKFDLTGNTKMAIPLILDLQAERVIWTDLALSKNPSEVNNVHHNLSSLGLLCQTMVQLQKPSLYDLFALHIDARGEQVYNPEQAQTIFAVDQGITPWDIDTIISAFV
jgi:ankyrin repeat protein/stress response protein SCP2